ncbi:hypothetical protein ACS0TY_036061 [Phlomoides rotata]
MDKIIEITDDLHFSTITKLNFTLIGASAFEWIECSADGLLLLKIINGTHYGNELYVCNPITREYIDLLYPFDTSISEFVIYGFGMSKTTGLYKVVGIMKINDFGRVTDCKVYTIGTGSWRTFAPNVQVIYTLKRSGRFVNGSLHWVAHDSNGTMCISCFDLETELFYTFSSPFPTEFAYVNAKVIALEGRLCLCDYTYTLNDCTLNVWLMKEYGVEKSWTKEFAIQSKHIYSPIRLSKDGVILMDVKSYSLFYYSSKNNTTLKICKFVGHPYNFPVSHTPSLFSLKSFETENSISF